MINKERKRLHWTNLKFKHKKKNITTAQKELTLKESVAILDGSPSDNHVNYSHSDQGPGSKIPSTIEGDVGLVEWWHWRDPKPNFSDDDTLHLVS